MSDALIASKETVSNTSDTDFINRFQIISIRLDPGQDLKYTFSFVLRKLYFFHAARTNTADKQIFYSESNHGRGSFPLIDSAGIDLYCGTRSSNIFIYLLADMQSIQIENNFNADTLLLSFIAVPT